MAETASTSDSTPETSSSHAHDAGGASRRERAKSGETRCARGPAVPSADEVPTIAFPLAMLAVHELLYPGRHAELLMAWSEVTAGTTEPAPEARLPEDHERRLARCELFLRHELMNDRLELVHRGSDGSLTRYDRESMRESCEQHARRMENLGLLRLADHLRGHLPYSDTMREELAMLHDLLDLPQTMLAARRNIGFVADEFLACLEQLKRSLGDVAQRHELAHAKLDEDSERRLGLREPQKRAGRPKGTFKPLQSRIVGLLVEAGDADLSPRAIRARLIRQRGVRSCNGRYIEFTMGTRRQRTKWSSLRDGLPRLRAEAAARLEDRKK